MGEPDRVELGFLRHAHAGDRTTWTGPDDERPLTRKGERQAERLGRFLVAGGWIPDAVLTSPLARAAGTAEIVAAALGRPVVVEPRLAEAFDYSTLEAILVDAGDPVRPLLVGHDPDFTELVSGLCDARELFMRKGSFARVDAVRPLGPGTGTLRWLVPPDLLEDRV